MTGGIDIIYHPPFQLIVTKYRAITYERYQNDVKIIPMYKVHRQKINGNEFLMIESLDKLDILINFAHENLKEMMNSNISLSWH
jgi:hypothetical protein